LVLVLNFHLFFIFFYFFFEVIFFFFFVFISFFLQVLFGMQVSLAIKDGRLKPLFSFAIKDEPIFNSERKKW